MSIKVGIVGAGVMGSGHAKFITEFVPDATVVGLFDVDSEKASKLAKEIGSVKNIFNSVEDLIKSGDIDAVIIASPDPLHVSHLRIAIESKKPTLCEKPIATNIEDARLIAQEIAEYEQKSGSTRIYFGFMRRFDTAYIEVKKLIESGRFGAPLFVRTITRNPASTGATTTGLFTNIAIHDFDIFRWLLNSDWVSVQSHYPKQSSLSPAEVADPLIFTAKMANGVMMVADIVAFNNYGYDVRAEVLCEKGSIEIGINGDVITRVDRKAGSLTGGKMEENWIPRFKESYINELRAWVEVLNSGVPNGDLATVSDALAANEACELGIKSI
jgi:myo-inositol 2-dehydrogenase / D-chiro-inositol 1-dehydrogenase